MFLVGSIIRNQYIPRFGGVLQECGDFTWRVSDCEELEGGYSYKDNKTNQEVLLPSSL